MKKILITVLFSFLLVGCGGDDMPKYERISEKEAQVILENIQEDHLIVDVRTVEEYNDGHIKGAINVPLDDILEGDVSDVLKDQHQKLFVYCRSGNRSVKASDRLYELGYDNITEMGGILDWEGPIE